MKGMKKIKLGGTKLKKKRERDKKTNGKNILRCF